jgi:hypothetical protein
MARRLRVGSPEKHSPPKPLPHQIPIDGQPLNASRAFVLRRLSDAGPYTGSPARARPASETLHESRLTACILADLIVTHEVTNVGNDRSQLAGAAKQAKDTLRKGQMTCVAPALPLAVRAYDGALAAVGTRHAKPSRDRRESAGGWLAGAGGGCLPALLLVSTTFSTTTSGGKRTLVNALAASSGWSADQRSTRSRSPWRQPRRARQFIGTVTIIPFMPDGWDASAGGFPAMTGNVPFLMKDIVLLAVSVYLLRQDVMRVSSAAKQKHQLSAVILSH